MANPIRDGEGQLQGFVNVLRDETDQKLKAEEQEIAHEEERTRLQTAAQSAGEALDRSKEELRALAANLLTVQEEERRRIARDLHDDLAQRLAMLEVGIGKLRLDLPGDLVETREGLKRLERQTAGLSNSVRSLSHRLHRPSSTTLGCT